MKKLFIIIAVGLTSFHLMNCGYYSMAGSIPPHIKSVAIPLLENQTAEYGVSEEITDNLIGMFTEENILNIREEDNSDSILRGRIISVKDSPFTYSQMEAVSEFRLTIKIDVEWYDIQNDKVILDKQYSGWGAYGFGEDISSDGVDNDGDGVMDEDDSDEVGDARTFATKVAVEKIAQDIINDILSDW